MRLKLITPILKTKSGLPYQVLEGAHESRLGPYRFIAVFDGDLDTRMINRMQILYQAKLLSSFLSIMFINERSGCFSIVYRDQTYRNCTGTDYEYMTERLTRRSYVAHLGKRIYDDFSELASQPERCQASFGSKIDPDYWGVRAKGHLDKNVRSVLDHPEISEEAYVELLNLYSQYNPTVTVDYGPYRLVGGET